MREAVDKDGLQEPLGVVEGPARHCNAVGWRVKY